MGIESDKQCHVWWKLLSTQSKIKWPKYTPLSPDTLKMTQ